MFYNTSSSISRCLSRAVLGCRLSSEVNAGLPELLVDGWSRLPNGSAEMAEKSASEKLSDERMRGGGTGLIGRRLTCEWIVGKKGETENSKQQKQNKNVTKTV